MSRIPVYQQRTVSDGTAPRATSGTGEGLQALGQAVQSIADDHERVSYARAANGMAELRAQASVLQAQLRAEASSDGSGHAEQLQKAYRAKVTELAGGIGGRMAQTIFRGQAKRLEYELDADARAWEIGTRSAFQAKQFEDATPKVAAAVAANPQTFATALAEQEFALQHAGVEPARRNAILSNMRASVTEAAAGGVAAQYPLAALSILDGKAQGGPFAEVFASLSPEMRQRVGTRAKNAIVDREVTRIAGTFETAGTDAGTAALSALSTSDLPPELRDDVRSRVNEQVNQLRTQRRQEQADALTSVETAIARDQAGRRTHQQVDQLYDVGALTPMERANYHAAIERSTVSRTKANAASTEFRVAVAAGLPLDPQDSGQQRAYAAAFAQDTTAAPVGSQPWQQLATAWAARTRLLPPQAESWVRSALRSPNPSIAAEAAQFYGNVMASAPDAASQFDVPTKAFASTVSRMIETGASPALAVQTARENTLEMRPELLERRQAAYKQHAKGSDMALQSLVGRDFDAGLFARDPSVLAMLSTDFESQTARYFENTGDINQARELAWTDLRRVYGPSKVNGEPQMMVFPPERLGLTRADIDRDLEKVLKANPQGDGVKASDLILDSDSLTLREVGDVLTGRPVAPSYGLRLPNGLPLLSPRGLRQRYTLPTGEALAERLRAAETAAEAEAQASVEAARRERQRRADELSQRNQTVTPAF